MGKWLLTLIAIFPVSFIRWLGRVLLYLNKKVYGPGHFSLISFSWSGFRFITKFLIEEYESTSNIKFLSKGLFLILKIKSMALSFKASQPKPQMDSVGCTKTLPALSQLIEWFKSSALLFKLWVKLLVFF